jgi:hypothetical protein
MVSLREGQPGAYVFPYNCLTYAFLLAFLGAILSSGFVLWISCGVDASGGGFGIEEVRARPQKFACGRAR